MRVLHFIDAGRPLLREFSRARCESCFDDRVLACREVVMRSCDVHDHRVCLIGITRSRERMARLGFEPDHVIPPILGRANLTVGAVSRTIRDVRPDIVHWWNRRWTAGCFGRPGRAWKLEAVFGTTPMTLPLWLSKGVALTCGPREHQAAAAADLQPFDIPPPAFVDSVNRAQPEQEPSLLLLGPHADAREFLFMCGLIWGSGTHLRAIVSANSIGLDRTRRVGRTFQYPVRVTTSDRPRSELLSQCTAAIWMGPSRPRTVSPAISVHSALCAGVPVAVPSEVDWLIPEALRAHMVARNSTANELARIIIPLLQDPSRITGFGGPTAANSANRAFVDGILDAYEERASPKRQVEWTAEFAHSPAA